MATTHEIHPPGDHRVLYAILGLIVVALIIAGAFYYNDASFREDVDTSATRVENTFTPTVGETPNDNTAGGVASPAGGTTAY